MLNLFHLFLLITLFSEMSIVFFINMPFVNQYKQSKSTAQHKQKGNEEQPISPLMSLNKKDIDQNKSSDIPKTVEAPKQNSFPECETKNRLNWTESIYNKIIKHCFKPLKKCIKTRCIKKYYFRTLPTDVINILCWHLANSIRDDLSKIISLNDEELKKILTMYSQFFYISKDFHKAFIIAVHTSQLFPDIFKKIYVPGYDDVLIKKHYPIHMIEYRTSNIKKYLMTYYVPKNKNYIKKPTQYVKSIPGLIEILKTQLRKYENLTKNNNPLTLYNTYHILHNIDYKGENMTFDVGYDEIGNDSASQNKALKTLFYRIIINIIKKTFDEYQFLKRDLLIKSLIRLYAKYKTQNQILAYVFAKGIFYITCLQTLKGTQYLAFLHEFKDHQPNSSFNYDQLYKAHITYIKEKYFFDCPEFAPINTNRIDKEEDLLDYVSHITAAVSNHSRKKVLYIENNTKVGNCYPDDSLNYDNINIAFIESFLKKNTEKASTPYITMEKMFPITIKPIYIERPIDLHILRMALVIQCILFYASPSKLCNTFQPEARYTTNILPRLIENTRQSIIKNHLMSLNNKISKEELFFLQEYIADDNTNFIKHCNLYITLPYNLNTIVSNRISLWDSKKPIKLIENYNIKSQPYKYNNFLYAAEIIVQNPNTPEQTIQKSCHTMFSDLHSRLLKNLEKIENQINGTLHNIPLMYQVYTNSKNFNHRMTLQAVFESGSMGDKIITCGDKIITWLMASFSNHELKTIINRISKLEIDRLKEEIRLIKAEDALTIGELATSLTRVMDIYHKYSDDLKTLYIKCIGTSARYVNTLDNVTHVIKHQINYLQKEESYLHRAALLSNLLTILEG